MTFTRQISEHSGLLRSLCSDSGSVRVDIKKKYSRRQWIIFCLFLLLNITTALTFSVHGPIFPAEAEKKGVTSSIYGFVFGIYELVAFLSSPLYGKFIGNLGSEFILHSGNFIMAVCCILFGLLDMVASSVTFISLAFTIRIVEAMGSSAFITASNAIIADEFTDSFATIFSIMETCYGVGIIAGPAIGGALFQLAGYWLPFIFLGSAVFVAATITFFLMPNHVMPSKKPRSYSRILCIPGVFLSFCTVFTGALSIGFITATMEPHLRQFNLSPTSTGAVFMVTGSFYALSAPAWGYLADKFIHPKIFSGIASSSIIIAFTFIGPAPFIPLQSNLWLVIVSLAFEGIGLSGTYVCGFLDAIRDTYEYGFSNDLNTYGLVAGLWSSSVALGCFIGPSVGGVLLEQVGFRKATLFVFTLQILMAMSSFGFYFWKNRSSKKKETGEKTVLINT